MLRPDGFVFAAGISRFNSLVDGLVHGYLFDPDSRQFVAQDLATGPLRNPAEHPGWFTSAYFHHPDLVETEARRAGPHEIEVLGNQGITSSSFAQIAEDWEDPAHRENTLEAIRVTESEPSLSGLSAHMLIVARHA